MMKLIFCLQINKRFLQIDTIITQNNFVISLQYLKKEVSGEVDFLHADKDESFLRIDTMSFYGDGQAFRKFPK